METESFDCDLCGGARRELIFEKVEEGFPAKVVRCPDCGLVRTDPRPVQSDLVRMYQATYGESPRIAAREAGTLRRFVVRHDLLRSAWHFLAGQCLSDFIGKARGRVLDVGCGTGDLLEEVVARGCEGYGVEFNPDSVARCNKRGLKVQCGDLDGAVFDDAFFDTVVFWHSLEHLPSPRRSLRKALRILRTGGRVFIYLPNSSSYLRAWAGPDWFPWHLPFHFYHFTPETLARLAEAEGFRVRALRTLTAEFSPGYTMNARYFGKPGLGGALARRRFFGSGAFRALIIPVIRALDLAMPSRGEFIFAELAKP